MAALVLVVVVVVVMVAVLVMERNEVKEEAQLRSRTFKEAITQEDHQRKEITHKKESRTSASSRSCWRMAAGLRS